MNELEECIGIATGVSSGIGCAIANVLAESDTVAYTVSRVGAVKEGLPLSAGDVIHVKGDVTGARGVSASISSIAVDSGLDFIVNSAGIIKKRRVQQPPIEEFRSITEVNITSLFTLSQTYYPCSTKSRFKGRITNISSMAVHLGLVEVVSYCTNKAVICGLIGGLAVGWVNDNICVNSVAPSWLLSEMSKQVVTPEREAATLTRMLVYAFGDSGDLGEMAKLLLSNHTRYITGQNFAMDGGALVYGY